MRRLIVNTIGGAVSKENIFLCHVIKIYLR